MYLPVPGLDLALQRWWSQWIMRGRRGAAVYRADEAGWVLTYTFRYRLTALVTFAAFTALYLGAYDEGDVFVATLKGVLLTAGASILWLLCAGFLVSSLIERVVVAPTELRRRSWRGRQSMVWGEVSRVDVREQNADLRISAASGAAIDVSLYLDGLRACADAIAGHGRKLPGGLAMLLPRA